MDNWYRLGSGVSRSLRDGEFDEEEIWDVLRDGTDSNSNLGRFEEYPATVQRNLPKATIMITGANVSGNNSSNSSSCSSRSLSDEAKIMQQSAPVNIPDWPRICRKKSKKVSSNTASSWIDGNESDDYDYKNVVVHDYRYSDDDEEDEGDGGEYSFKLPPHELIARRHSRSQISSFSVVEGAGRTLKGRDLKKVRNAILTQTGFLEDH